MLATYTVRIEADPHEAPILLSNGNLQERGTLDGGKRHYAVWHDPHPKPCYLFALVGGDLAPITSTFKTMSGRKVDLAIYVEHGKEARAAWAMDSLKRSMRWDEQRFGREYDLDVFNIVAVSDFNMGAMENKGLNIFNDRLILASPETATDAIFEAIESVVAHEYFHNWTGNRITCRDWFQLCLKEGLTVFRDQEFSADERSATVQRIIDVRAAEGASVRRGRGAPGASGAAGELHRDQQLLYGDRLREGRRAGAHDRDHPRPRRLPPRHGPLLRAPRRRGGDDRGLRHLLRGRERRATSRTSSSGTRRRARRSWSALCATTRTRRPPSSRSSRSSPPTPGQPKKKPLHIPLRLGLLGANGHEIDLKLDGGEDVDRRRGARHQARADASASPTSPRAPVPSLLRGFSAPVNLTLDLTDDDLEFLMAHDSDLFNRWQAANTYATRTLIESGRGLAPGQASNRGLRFAPGARAAAQRRRTSSPPTAPSC